jgi:predicted AAA+ superfamily ATPase
VIASTAWSAHPLTCHYWREAAGGYEVDLVISDDRGRRVGVEVKASSQFSARDLRGLQRLRASAGLHRGYIVYTGSDLQPIEPDIWLLPVAALASLTPTRS